MCRMPWYIKIVALYVNMFYKDKSNLLNYLPGDLLFSNFKL